MKKVVMASTDTRVPIKNNQICNRCKGTGVVRKKVSFILLNVHCPVCSGGIE